MKKLRKLIAMLLLKQAKPEEIMEIAAALTQPNEAGYQAADPEEQVDRTLLNKAMLKAQIKSFIIDVALARFTSIYGTTLSEIAFDKIVEDLCRKIDLSRDYNRKVVEKELQSWINNAIERKAYGL